MQSKTKAKSATTGKAAPQAPGKTAFPSKANPPVKSAALGQPQTSKRDRGVEGVDYPDRAGRDRMKPAVDRLIAQSRDLGMTIKPFETAANRFFSDPGKDTYETFKTEFSELRGIGPRSDAERRQRETREREVRGQEQLDREQDQDAIARLRDGRLTADQFRQQLGSDEDLFQSYERGDLNWRDLQTAYGDFGRALDTSKQVGGPALHDRLYRDMASDGAALHRHLRSLDHQVADKSADDAWQAVQSVAAESNLPGHLRTSLANLSAKEMEARGRRDAAGDLRRLANDQESRETNRRDAMLAAATLDRKVERNFDAVSEVDRRQDQLYQNLLNADRLTTDQLNAQIDQYDQDRDAYLEKIYGQGGPNFGPTPAAQTLQTYLKRPGRTIANEALLRRAENDHRELLQRRQYADSSRLNAALGRAAGDPNTDLTNMQLGGPPPLHLSANMRRTHLHDHDLSGRDLSGSDLRNVRLRRTNLAGADLTNVDVTGAQLDRTNLAGTDLRRTQGLSEADMRGSYYDGQTRFPHGFDPDNAGMVRMLTPQDGFDVHRQHTPSMFHPQLNARTLQAGGQFPNPLHGQQNQPLLVDHDRFFDNRQLDHQNSVRTQAQTERDLLAKHGGWAGTQEYIDRLANDVGRDVLTERGLDPADPKNKEALDRQVTASRQNLQSMMLPMHAQAAQRADGLEGADFSKALTEHFSQVEQEFINRAGAGQGVGQEELDRYWAALPQDALTDPAGQAWDKLSEADREQLMGQMVHERADLAQSVLQGYRRTQQAIAGTRTSLRENAGLASVFGNGPQNHRTADYSAHLRSEVSRALDFANEDLHKIRDAADSGHAAYADAMFRDMFGHQGPGRIYRPFENVQGRLQDYAEKVKPSFEDLKNAAFRGGAEHIIGMGQAVKDHPVEAGALATVTAAGMYFAPEVALPVLFAVGAKSAFDNTREGMRLWQEGTKNNNINQMLAGAGKFGAAGVDTALLAADGVATVNALKSAHAARVANGLSVWQYPKFALSQRATRLAESAKKAGQWLRRQPAALEPATPSRPNTPLTPAPGTPQYDELVDQLRTKQTRLDRMRRGLQQREAGPLPQGQRGHGVDGLPTDATAAQAKQQVRLLEEQVAQTQAALRAADQKAALNAYQRAQKILGMGDVDAAARQARKEGLAFRSLNDQNIADILDGRGMPAKGGNGSTDALIDTVYYDGKRPDSAFTPTTEAPPALLPKGDPDNFVTLDAQGLRQRGKYRTDIPPEPGKQQWRDQQKHTVTIGDIEPRDIVGMRLGGVDYPPAALDELIKRVQKFDGAFSDGQMVTLTQSGPPYGTANVPLDDFLKMTKWHADDLANLDRTFSLYLDPKPPNGGAPTIIHALGD